MVGSKCMGLIVSRAGASLVGDEQRRLGEPRNPARQRRSEDVILGGRGDQRRSEEDRRWAKGCVVMQPYFRPKLQEFWSCEFANS